MGFNGLLLNFNWFCRDSLDLTEFEWLIIRFYWVLLDFNWFYWVS